MISIYEKNQPQAHIKWAIYKGGQVKENLDAAILKVWLVSRANRILLDVAYDGEGNITASIPKLIAGVYGLKAIWIKGSNSPLPTKGMSEVQLVLNVQSQLTEDCISNDITIGVKSEVNTSYGYDGMDAYELAVFRGTTSSSEEDWLKSRAVTATVQGEGTDKTAVMSQDAVTKALEALRSVLGSAYHTCGKVDTLPTTANVGDIYYLSSDKHSYACVGKENKYQITIGWKTEDDSELNPMVQGYLNGLEVGKPSTLPCSTTEMPYFTPKALFTGTLYVFGIFPCDEDGEVTNTTPVYLDNGTFKWSVPPNEDKIFVGKVTSEKHIGDAIWQDYGVLETIDYTPKASDTEYTPSEKSMFTTEDNTQDALDKVGEVTPSLEQNLAIAVNINSQIVNENFSSLLNRYNRLIEIMQMMIDRVAYIDPAGFKDMSDLISGLQFEDLKSVGRITTGGELSSDTSVAGSAKAGSAKAGKI